MATKVVVSQVIMEVRRKGRVGLDQNLGPRLRNTMVVE